MRICGVFFFQMVFFSGVLLHVVSATTSVISLSSFDYTSLSQQKNANALLEALKQDGIVSIKNIPQYQDLREDYLMQAAKCALQAQASSKSKNNDFLLYKKLQDGTMRYTISTESGKKLPLAAKETEASCPEYRQKYLAFSDLLENAVKSVGSALDKTTFAISKPSSSNSQVINAAEFMSESIHLDHFHAYEAASITTSKSESPLSVEMHTDNGMLIAMTTPKYFEVDPNGALKTKSLPEEDAGLIIETKDGQIVRPLLKSDELIIMVGSGFDQWIQTSDKLRPVPHGMKYPKITADLLQDNHKVIRAWFGKMILLQSDDQMQSTGLTFGEYASRITRYLLQQEQQEEQAHLVAAACPHGRRLEASDEKCTLKVCTPKEGKTPSEPCSTICNRNHDDDAVDCEENCVCQDSAESAVICWMLCVKELPKDQCPSGEQECVDQQRECVAVGSSQNSSSSSSSTTSTPTPAPSPSSFAISSTKLSSMTSSIAFIVTIFLMIVTVG
jgi:hypothetical protein